MLLALTLSADEVVRSGGAPENGSRFVTTRRKTPRNHVVFPGSRVSLLMPARSKPATLQGHPRIGYGMARRGSSITQCLIDTTKPPVPALPAHAGVDPLKEVRR